MYEGDGRAKMVHFVFDMIQTRAILPAFSDQSQLEVINLALLAVKQEALRVLPRQHPGFNYSTCEQQLAFLPSDLREAILATVSINRLNQSEQ